MRFHGELIVRARPSTVWSLIAHPESWPRYTPKFARVEMLGQKEGVGARPYMVWTLNGRRLPCEEFVQVWEPLRRIHATATAGGIISDYEYELTPIEGDYRDSNAPKTRIAWTMTVRFTTLVWLLMPLLCFLPLILAKLLTSRQQNESWSRMTRVAEAEERGGVRVRVEGSGAGAELEVPQGDERTKERFRS